MGTHNTLDMTLLRAEPGLFRASQVSRGEDPTVVDRVLEMDARVRASKTSGANLRNAQKTKGRLLKGALPPERETLLAELKDLAHQIKNVERLESNLGGNLDQLTNGVANLVHPDAPEGGEDDAVVVGTFGTLPQHSFTPQDHADLGRSLGLVDLERGAKVSGSRFFFLTGQGARLQRALVNLALDTAEEDGRVPVVPPVLVRSSAMRGTGFLGAHSDEVYHLPQDDLYLVGTSEVPLAAFHADEFLEARPYRYVASSTCFRREAGGHGKDTRGIFRVHQFEKVEMFSFVPVEDAEAEHQRILEAEKRFLTMLELPFQVVDVAAGDLGSSAARKFDCEAWFPGQGRYREVTSASNCTTYQARRLQVRTRTTEGVRPMATLNGTLCATSRIIAAILENHQDADGSVRVPDALVPYMRTDRLVPA